MARNIEPLKTGGQPSLPLSAEPFNSRVESEIDFEGSAGTKPKNYQFVAFRPGFPLQGSELNEMQEHFQVQMTLSLNMMNNWITSGAGPMWYGHNNNAPGDGGGSSSISRNTGLGIGGDGFDTTPDHNTQYAISGPGWRGSTPLWPFHCPYTPSLQSLPHKLVEVSVSQNVVSVQFNSGWYLVDLPLENPDDGSNRDISGLKHWVWLDTAFDGNATDEQFVVDLNISNHLDHDFWIPVGLNISTSYYDCHCTDFNNCDDTLGDNAAGFSNPVACGASRYAVNIASAGTVYANEWPVENQWSSNAQGIYNKLSLVCKVNPFKKTVRYMNNIVLDSWT